MNGLALQRGAGIRDNNVDTTEMLGRTVKGRADRGGIGDIASQAERRAVEPGGGLFRGGAVEIGEHGLGAGCTHRRGGREPDRAGAAGHQRDLAGQRLFLGAAELCLFERPVFHREQFGLGQ